MNRELDAALRAGDAALQGGSAEDAHEHLKTAYRMGVAALATSDPHALDLARRDLLRIQDRLTSCLEALGAPGPAAFAANAAVELAVVLREPQPEIERRRAKLNALNAALGLPAVIEAPLRGNVDESAGAVPSHFRIVRVDVPMIYNVTVDGVAVSDDAMAATCVALAEQHPPVALEIVVQGGRLAIGATAVVVDAARDAAFNRVGLSLAPGSVGTGTSHVIELGEDERTVPALVAGDRALQAGAARVVLVFA